MTVSSTAPKYKLNDQVNKKINTGIFLKTGASIGTVIKVIEKHNVRGRICYYYGVKWPDDDLVPAKAEGKESLMAYCNHTPDIEWTLISLDNSIEEAQLCDVL